MIPKILQLHWFWSGWPPFGNRVVSAWTAALPGWEIKVMRKIPEDFPAEFRPFLTEDRIPPANRADLVRNWTMWRYGGVYVDFDTRPIREIDDLLLSKKCFIPRCTFDTTEDKVNIGFIDSCFIGSEPGLDFWERVWDRCWRPDTWMSPSQWFCGVNTFAGDNPDYVEFIPDLCQEATSEECADFISGNWELPTRSDKYLMHYRTSGKLPEYCHDPSHHEYSNWLDVYEGLPVNKRVPEWA